MSGIVTMAVIILIAVVLFVWNRFPVVIVAMGVAVGLYATGLLTIGEAFAGLGDPAVVFIASLFIVSAGLEVTGVTAWAGQQLIAHSGRESHFCAGVRASFVTLNVDPAAVLAAYRIGDSPVNSITPLNAYFALVVGVAPWSAFPGEYSRNKSDHAQYDKDLDHEQRADDRRQGCRRSSDAVSVG